MDVIQPAADFMSYFDCRWNNYLGKANIIQMVYSSSGVMSL